MRVLWCMNVYSRLNHLRLQQSLLRRAFGNLIDISVFTNHETNGDQVPFLEDFLYHCPVNSGGHTGCRDAFNHGLTLSADYDVIVWSHADCVLSDYSAVLEPVLEGLRANPQRAFASLHRSEGSGRRGHGPYALNDLTVWRSDFYRRVFPQHEDLDGWKHPDGRYQPGHFPGATITECVERSLGQWVRDALLPGEEWLVMSGNPSDPRVNPPGGMDDGLDDIMGTGVGCRWHDQFQPTADWLLGVRPELATDPAIRGIIDNQLPDARADNPGLLSRPEDAGLLRSLHLLPPPARRRGDR